VEGTSSQHEDVENLVAILNKESTAFALSIDGIPTDPVRARERIRISENPSVIANSQTQEWVLQKVGRSWIPKTQVAPKLIYPGASILLWIDEDGLGCEDCDRS
jgi:hypothetical protein